MNLDRFRIRPGDRAALKRHATDDTGRFTSKESAAPYLQKGIARIGDLQELLYAQDRHALLLIFQGMDAAGKDSTIKHVMSGANPQSTEVHAFKQPSNEELGHDFLWRAAKALPARGRIGIFNRSYYEEVLVVRVHSELLDAEKLPRSLVSKRIWKERYEDINDFERHLVRNGTIIRKFYLHLSKPEQERRLLQRLDDPAKNWKFSPADLSERGRWNEYRTAYEKALAATSRRDAPWYVIPADHKWFAQVLVSAVIVQALESLNLKFPTVSPEQRLALGRARRKLAGR